MAGLVPAIPLRKAQRLNDLVVKVAPRRVVVRNGSRLPGARPIFDILFSLDRGAGRIEDFEIDELVYSVFFRVALDEFVFVFMDPTDKVTCYARIQRTNGTAREDVQIILLHNRTLWPAFCRPSRLARQCARDWDRRDKPGDGK